MNKDINKIIFYNQISKSYAFDQMEYMLSEEWQKVRTLFVDNYFITPIDSVYNIPRKIHQIWLGSKLPEKYLKYTESWKQIHPNWEYKLWTDEDIKTFNFSENGRNVFDNAVNQGMKSDVLRYEILNQFGGLYVDTDFECLKSFDILLHYNFFTGIGFDGKLQLYNGLIASVPNHNIMKEMLERMQIYKGNKGSAILNVTGANLFTQVFLENCNLKNMIAFPTDFFYPLPNKETTNNPYQFVKPCSYAIHHWAVSWVNKKKK